MFFSSMITSGLELKLVRFTSLEEIIDKLHRKLRRSRLSFFSPSTVPLILCC